MLLRKYAELLRGHTAIAMALARVNFEHTVKKIVLVGLAGNRSHGGAQPIRSHDCVIALDTLRRLLTESPERLGGDDSWAVDVRERAVNSVVDIILRGLESRNFQEGSAASPNSGYLLALQLVTGALHCLRLLWPKDCATGADDEGGEVGRVASGASGRHSARRPPPPIDLDRDHRTADSQGLVSLLATQVCHGSTPQLQTAAADLLSHVVATGAEEVLAKALTALTRALLEPTPSSRRREALQQVAPLITRWLEATRGTAALVLAESIHRMQALGLLLLGEACPRLRGEAAQLLTILSPVAAAADADADARGGADARADAG